MRERIDEIDLAIVKQLWDGRKPYSEVADKLGVATNTVRNRVNKMIESGALQIIALLNPDVLPDHQSAYIGIKVEPQKLQVAVQQISALKGVVAAVQVSGRFDIIALAMFNATYTFRQFHEERISQVDGILSTESFFVTPGDQFQLRYVL